MGSQVCNFMDMSLKGRGTPLSHVPLSPHSSWNMVMEEGMTEQQDRAAWVSEPQKQNHQTGTGLPTQKLLCHRERLFKPLFFAFMTHSRTYFVTKTKGTRFTMVKMAKPSESEHLVLHSKSIHHLLPM